MREEKGMTAVRKRPESVILTPFEHNVDVAPVQTGESSAIPAKALPSRTQPTLKEIQEHVLMPPRSWCGHCLRERGTSLPHFRSETEGEHVVPIVSIDYFFMGPSGVLKMLAVKSHE